MVNRLCRSYTVTETGNKEKIREERQLFFQHHDQTPSPYDRMPAAGNQRMGGMPLSGLEFGPPVHPPGPQPFDIGNPKPIPVPADRADSFGTPDLNSVTEWSEPSFPEERQQPQPQLFPGGWLPEGLQRRLREIERNQEQFDRQLRRLDRRVTVIERRLGIPAPRDGYLE